MTAGKTVVTQEPAPTAKRKLAIEGLIPPGRKKLVNAEETQGKPLFGLMPKGAEPVPTWNGPAEALEAGSLKAACQFAVSRSPRTVLALIGRFRWRPPLKL